MSEAVILYGCDAYELVLDSNFLCRQITMACF